MDIPQSVRDAMASLRRDLDDIHEVHECDDGCPDPCPDNIGPAFDYSDDDEHNAEVREAIETSASVLLRALDAWRASHAFRPYADIPDMCVAELPDSGDTCNRSREEHLCPHGYVDDCDYCHPS